SSLTVKRIGPIDQNLIIPLRKTCKCLGHVVPGHRKKYHFASRCLFPGGSRCSRTKLIDNFSQAVRASAIAKLYLMADLQCPFCERLCESSCSNDSDFHKLSFPNMSLASIHEPSIRVCKEKRSRLPLRLFGRRLEIGLPLRPRVRPPRDLIQLEDRHARSVALTLPGTPS